MTILSFKLQKPFSKSQGNGGHHPYATPDAAAFVQSTEEVSEIVKILRSSQGVGNPFWRGHRLGRQCRSVRGGVCIDISGMNLILQVNTGDLDATLEAGVRHENSFVYCEH
jgi:D-lactate dehydrogenase (cytochrome)